MDVEARHRCPVIGNVVNLVVRGEVVGQTVKGEVIRCYAYTAGACRKIYSSYCLVGKEIETLALT